MGPLFEQDFTLDWRDPDAKATAAPIRIETTVRSELTEGYSTGRTVQTVHDQLEAVQAADGQPIVFAVDSQRRLIVIHQATGGSAERGQVHLAHDKGSVQAFGVGQSAAGTFVLAIAVQSAPNTCAVYVTAPLPNDPARVDWYTLKWHRRGTKAGAVGDRLIVGEEPADPRKPEAGPLMVLVTTERGEAKHYAVDADTRTPEAQWAPLDLGQDVERIVDLVIGEDEEGGPGIYALCHQQGSPILLFVPHDEYGTVARLPVPAAPSMRRGALAVRHGDGSNELYVAGDGVFMLPPDEQRENGRYETIVSADRLRGARNLILRQDDRAVSLWCLDADDVLHEVSGDKAGAAIQWSAPIAMGSDVKRLAPLRNRHLHADSLVLFTQAERLESWTMSPQSECWTRRELAVEDEYETTQFDCYASTVIMTRTDGLPFANQTLRLGCAEWTEVIVNGAAHELRPGRTATVETDAAGQVTILTKVAGLSAPTLTLSGAGLSRPVPIDPTRKVWTGIESVQSGTDFEKIELDDGTRLVDGVDTSDLQSAAECLQRVAQTRQALPKDGTASTTYFDGPGLSEGEVLWGMHRDADGLHFNTGQAAMVPMQAAMAKVDVSGYEAQVDGADPLGNAMVRAAGAIFDWFRARFDAFFSFVVRKVGQAVEFVIAIGEEAWRFVVKCLAHVHELGQSVLRQIGVGLEKLRKWVGFLFNWQDIVVTHDVMVNVAEQVVWKTRQAITGARDRVAEGFDYVIKEVRKLGKTPIKAPAANGRVSEARGRLPEQTKEGVEASSEFAKTPQGNFVGYHSRNSVGTQTFASFYADANLTDDARSLLDGLIDDLTEIVTGAKTTIEGFVDTLIGLLQGKQHTVNSLLAGLGSAGLEAFLKIARLLVTKLINLGDRLVGAVWQLVADTRKIPFLSALYGRLVPGREASLLRMITLALAAPITVVYKAFAGEAPFPFVDTDGLDAAALETLSTDPQYATASRRPETYGLDSLAGAAFWAFLTVTAGVGVGKPAYKALMKLNKGFAASNTAKPAMSVKVIAVASLAWQVFSFVRVGVMLAVKAPALGGAWVALRWLRLVTRGIYVIAAVVDCKDLTGKIGAGIYLFGAVCDAVLSTTYSIWRSTLDVQQGKPWLVAVSMTSLFGALTSTFGTLCTSIAAWVREGKPEAYAILLPLGYILIGGGTGMDVMTSVAPFLVDQIYELL